MKKVLAVVLALVMVLSLTACGGKGMAGTYKMTKMTQDGEEQDTKYFDLLAKEGIFFALVVNDDKTATLKMIGEDDEKLTYDDKYFEADGQKISYTKSGDTLTLKDEEGKSEMTFKKMSSSELKEFETPKSEEELMNAMIKVFSEMGDE